MQKCHSKTKKYTGKNATHFWHDLILDVDYELKDEWLDRLNSINGVQITWSCSGDLNPKHGSKYPSFSFVLSPPLTGAETLISDAFNLSVGISEKSDSTVTITCSLEPDDIDFEIKIYGGLATILDEYEHEVASFSVNDRRLLQIINDLDIKYTPKRKKNDPLHWSRPYVGVQSQVIHKPQNHHSIEEWWLDVLDALEDSASHL